MNRLTSLLLALPLLWGGLSGCSSSTDINEDTLPAPTENTFTVTDQILPLTRQPQLDGNGSGHFTAGDRNSLFFHSEQEHLTDAFTYTYGQTYYWKDLQLTSQAQELKVSGCYPPIETGTPEEVLWDVTRPDTYTDILLAGPVTVSRNSAEPVRLSFTHALHLLKVSLKADGVSLTDDDLKDVSISCRQVLPVAHLNLLTGKAVSATGTPCTLQAEGPVQSFIVPAQEVGQMNLLIRLGKREVVYELSQCQVNGKPLTRLESGASFGLTITVSENSFTLSGQDISGWTPQGDVNDSITI